MCEVKNWPQSFRAASTLTLLCFLILQVMVTNVTSLLKTVKAVEDEATRGTRALEATIECIKQELTVTFFVLILSPHTGVISYIVLFCHYFLTFILFHTCMTDFLLWKTKDQFGANDTGPITFNCLDLTIFVCSTRESRSFRFRTKMNEFNCFGKHLLSTFWDCMLICKTIWLWISIG